MTCTCTTSEKADCQCEPVSRMWTEAELRALIRDELAARFKGGQFIPKQHLVGEKPNTTFAININGKSVIV